MQTHKRMILLTVLALMVTTTGCEEDENENKRLAEMAERQLQRQVEQNRHMAELQHEVAEGARQLVQADAEAREEMVALHRDVQAERTEIGRQRDSLEDERKVIASQRHRDPVIAAAITNVGLLLACLLPLVLCWYLLRRPMEPADDGAVTEVLLQDLVSDNPLLLPRVEQPREIGCGDTGDTHCLTDASGDGDESA